MTPPQPGYRCTPREYLERERYADERHEYVDGEIILRAGGSPDHSLIISNVMGEVSSRLKGKPCRVYESNLRVCVARTTLYTYPDACVICGELQFDPCDTRKETVINPTLVVEALSPETERWDRGGKFQNYQQIDSLKEYLLVSSTRPLVETFLRQPDGSWVYRSAAGLDARARLTSLNVELALRDLYDGVDFPAGAGDSRGGGVWM